MITKKQKTIIFGLSSLLPIILGGCAAPADVKSNVRTAVAKPGNTYVIQQASIHTPATDRLWQQRRAERDQQLAAKRAHLLSLSRQRTQAAAIKPVSRPAARSTNSNTSAAKTLQQQNISRAQYHARYQAKQQAATQLQAARAARAAATARQPRPNHKPRVTQAARAQLAQNQARAAQAARAAQVSRTQLAQNKARAAQVSRAQLAQNQARAAQVSRAPLAQATPQRKTETSPRDKYLQRWEQLQAEKRLESKKADIKVERVINNAKKQIGTKYVWGGASPKTGFDCSGLVQHSIAAGANVKVPRTAAEQYNAAVKVPTQQASRGDLIFFKTRGNSVSHVGIYLGGEKFVHAPRTGLSVTTTKLAGYWKERFVGFGRIPGACKIPIRS